MNLAQTCPDCGSVLPPNAPKGLCPKCLIALASEPWVDETAVVSPGGSRVCEGAGESRLQEPEFGPFGDYVLLAEIAAGGMGVVYKARQAGLNRLVALKRIRDGQLATEDQVQRFRREAEAAAHLDHPNIVPIYEIGQHEGHHFFSMRLVEGNDLADELSDGPLPMRRAAQLLATVARAVHHAHQRGVLHRDLKPSNILLDHQGEPHLTDFGLAKLIESDHRLTQSIAVMGTIAYMPPEQARGQTNQITISADIYSLGAILYETLTGQAPFVGTDSVQMLRQVIESEPPSPHSLNPNIDRDLETICLKCLEKEPSRRYASAEALAADLHRWLNDEPILAKPVKPYQRAWKWVRRHPVTVALSAAIALSLVGGLVGVTWQWRRAEAQSTRLRFQRAEDHFAGDNTHLALAELARLVRDQPANRVAAERLLNALRQRVFFLPSTNAAPFARDSFKSATHGSRQAAIEDKVSIRVSEAASGVTLFTISNAHEFVIRSVRFNSNGTCLVTASGDRTAKIWDAQAHELFSLRHSEGVAYAEFNPSGSQVVTASRDHTARLWNATNGWPARDALRHLDAVNSARFSADGRLVATASDDGTARLWDAKTGSPASEPARLPCRVDDARFTGDSQHLIAFTNLNMPVVLKLSAGLALTTNMGVEAPTNFEGLKAQFASIYTADIVFATLSPNGACLATASADKTARLWQARPLRPLAEPLLHAATVNCVQFSPDGSRVATSTADRKVRLWDTQTGLPLSDWIRSEAPVAFVRFSTDGKSILTSAGWGWEFAHFERGAPDWLAPLAEAVAGLRLTASGLFEAVPAAEYFRLRERLLAAAGPDPLAQWAREFVKDDNIVAPQ